MDKIKSLKKISAINRLKVLDMIQKARMGHFGGIYSCMDILVSLYYGDIFNYSPVFPNWVDRDRLIIGKGHACLGLYAILSDLDIISEDEMMTYGKDGSIFGGQLDFNISGVETNTGSLGHAIGIASGIALAAKQDNKKYKTYALVGDGECDEGSIWESVMFASKNNLNNLVTIVDRNRLSVTDFIEFNNLEDKFGACDWDVHTINGHDFGAILETLNHTHTKPLVIIADTIKGKGVSFMESGIKWHHSVPTEEEFDIARNELNMEIDKWV